MDEERASALDRLASSFNLGLLSRIAMYLCAALQDCLPSGPIGRAEPHHKRMRTTNMLERQNQELRRRSRVVRIFPNAQSCLRLVSALLIENSHEWMCRLYLRMEEDPGTETHAQAT